MTVSVGFIGVGNMGNPMAGNILKAGFPMTVFDKHGPAMKNLIDAGAKAAIIAGLRDPNAPMPTPRSCARTSVPSVRGGSGPSSRRGRVRRRITSRARTASVTVIAPPIRVAI